jgi:hypothetical protein
MSCYRKKIWKFDLVWSGKELRTSHELRQCDSKEFMNLELTYHGYKETSVSNSV